MDGEGANGLESVATEDYADATDAMGTVIIGMGAPWCGPWRAFLPVFSEVAATLADDAVTFMTCDVEANAAIPLLEGVTRIPTVIVYHDGRRIGKHVGVMTAGELTIVVSAARSGAVSVAETG